MNFKPTLLAGLSLIATVCPGQAAFDLNAWKTEYGTPLTPATFYSTRPGPWGDYWKPNDAGCAANTFLYLGPLGIKARPFDQAVSTSVFAALYPPTLVDAGGLIQNAFGVMEAPAGSPADGKVYPGDIIIEMEDQRIKTATDVSFPFPVQQQNSRGLEIHAGQLVDTAEGRGAIKLKVLRAGLTAYTSPLLTAQTTAEVSVNVTGQNFVRLTSVSANNCLTNWINPRLENGSGGVIYLNTQAIVQQSGYASPQMGKDATGAAVVDGATVTNCIGTRANSMIEYAVPAGYTTLKFKVQTTGAGSATASIKTRKSTLATSPVTPRQFDASGAPILPPELTPYIETIEFTIPRIGSFGDSYDPHSEKVANYGAILAQRLASEQQADGSWLSGNGDYADASFRTSLAGLGLMATGDPAFNPHIKKAAEFCAAISPSGWAYPRGTRLMFIAEYYLRTRDAAILPGLQQAVHDAQKMVAADFVSGHGTNMGYGGGGYIGSTGTIATGLAIAAKTPVIVDVVKLDNMMERIQELCGGRGGGLPYGRAGIGRGPMSGIPSDGQNYSCGAGVVLATKIHGGPQYITELFRKKFGQATTYGDADHGHASEALTFIMGSLACGIWGDESHKANMNRYLWRLTLKRDYSGYINLNNNRLEFHGGDGACHGGPTYDTGGYLILLNEHKRNLAITGKPEAQAQVFTNVPPTYDVDRKIYWRVLNDWNMVEAALGAKMPASLLPKLAELRAMPLGIDLATRTFAFLQREALPAATLVNGISGLTSPERQQYCEMLLGIGHEIKVASIDTPVPISGLSNYQFSLNGYTASTAWVAWGGPAPSSEPVPSTQMAGSVTITDPSGIYLSSPRVINFGPGNLNPPATFKVTVDRQVNMTATYNYTVGGSLAISYSREIIFNPAVPFNVDSRAGDYTNLRKIWIPGNCSIPFENWNTPIQLPSGQYLPGTSKKEGGMGFYTYDNGTLVTANNAYKARIAGKPAGYWCVSSDIMGEVPVLGVNLLPGPVLTTTNVSAIASTSATSGGNVTSDSGWPVTRRGVCWSTSPYPSIFDNKTSDGTGIGTFTSALTNLEPGTNYHVRAYATNAIGTSYGVDVVFSTSGTSGIWTTVGSGSWANTTNWQSGIDASGADGIADFGTVTPTVDATVTLDGPRSIGGMIFGNTSFTKNWILNSGSGDSLTLDYGFNGYPGIAVNGGTATINTVLSGTDGLIKSGTGTLILNAANIFAGITAVNAGTLQLGGSLTSGGLVNVAAGATLVGTGTIAAATTVNGTIAPGVSGIGTLNLNGTLALGGTATMQINKSIGASDKMVGMGNVTYGGILNVTNLAGTLAAGDTFTLFSAASYSGSFTSVSLPTLSGALKWDTGNLLVDGSIRIVLDAIITGQPVNKSVDQGVSATFVVTATGSPAPTYQWQISTNGGSSWSNISGANGSSYATPPATSGDNGRQFRCVVANDFATLNSNAATLTVTANSLPAFTQHPADVVFAAAGATATFNVAVAGTPAPTLRWQISTDFGGVWTDIPGATSASYGFTSTAGDNNKAYRCVATNTVGNVTSKSALFLISTDPVWTNQDGGAWPTSTNWSNNAVANGTGVTADFSRLNLSAAPTVTLDGARTIGNLKFGDTANAFGWTLGNGTAGPLTLATSSGTPTITVNNQQALVSCVLAGSNGLAKAGAGNLILSGANTYSGGTTLSAGQLTLNHANALGGGALTITGGSLGNSSGAAISLAGTQTWNTNITYVGPDKLTLTSPVTLNSDRTVTVQDGELAISAVISGAYSLIKSGSDKLTLTAASTFSGETIVNAGTLQLGNNVSTDYGGTGRVRGTLTVNSGATLLSQGNSTLGWVSGVRVNALNLNGGTLIHAGNGDLGDGTVYNLTGATMQTTGSGQIDFAVNSAMNILASPVTSSISGRITLSQMNQVNFTVADGAAAIDLSVSASISGTAGINKHGAGVMRLSGAGTYASFTNINAGTVQLNGGSLGNGAVTVSSGATLSGNGGISGAATINGNLTTGVDAVTGTLAFTNNLTLASTTATAMKLRKSGGTASHDKVTVGGTLTCAGSLTVTASGDPLAASDGVFRLFSASAISGTFSSVNLPSLSGGLSWDTSRLYIDGTISLGGTTPSHTIAFGALGSVPYGWAMPLNATASSGLPVAFSSSNPNIAVVQFGNYLIAVGTGTTIITASQSGDSDHQAAADVTQSLTVNPTLPAVRTVSPTLLTSTSVSTGGDSIWDGGTAITERGVCWSTSPNPTVAGSRTTDGAGTVSFTSTITGLTKNTTYHFRSYVRNSLGYSYGENLSIVIPPETVSGVWIKDANGSWPTGTNWSGGASPNGIGSTADFNTVNLTGNRTVTLDAAVGISALTFGDATTASHNWTLSAGTGGSLTLDVISGTPQITVNNQTTTIGVPIAGLHGLNKLGLGTLTLSGANTYVGATLVSEGVVKIGNKNAFGAFVSGYPASQVTVASGAAVDFGGVGDASYGYTIAGTGVGGTGVLTNTGGGIGDGTAQASNIKLTANATIGGTGGWALSANDPDPTVLDLGGFTLTKVGSGSFGLMASKLTAGAIKIEGGRLNIGGGDGVIASAVAFTLDNTAGISMALSEDFIIGSLAGGGASGGHSSINKDKKLTIGALNTNTTYAGVISGEGELIKGGAGNLTFNAAHTYTGKTSIEGGVLSVNGSLANTATTVTSAGTLGGTGTVNGTVTATGTLAPGANGVGTLTINNKLTLAAGSKLAWEINNWTGAPGTGWDRMSVTSLDLTANSGNPITIRPVDLALANFSEANTTFVLIQTTSGITGFSADEFTVDTSGLTLPQGTWVVQQSGNNLVLAYSRKNAAPAFTSDPILANATEDNAFTGQLNATDADAGDTKTFTKIFGPPWLNVATNGALSGTPGGADVGLNSFTVRVTDSLNATDEAALNITVANVNDTPVFTANPFSKPVAVANRPYTGQTLAGSATDADASDNLSYALVSGPTWLTVATDGTLSGTPVTSDIGARSFVVSVTDSSNATSNATLNLDVIHATWTNLAGGSWNSATNWLGNAIGGGAGTTVRFDAINLTSDPIVYLDGARTIGGMIFGDTTPSNYWRLNTGSGGPLTLDATAGAPWIEVANQSATISAVLAGSEGLSKTGTGTLTLSATNTYTGTTLISGGIVKLGNKSAFGAVASGSPVTQVIVADGAAMDFNGIGDAYYGYTIAGSGIGGAGALINTGATISNGTGQATNIKLAADASIGGTGNWALLTSGWGATSLNLAGYTLTKTSANTIALASTTLTGGTLKVSDGTLAFGVSNGGSGVAGDLAALTLDNTSGVSFSLGRASSIGSLAGGGANGGNVTLVSGVLTVGALPTNTTYAGVISGGGGLTKAGSGILSLSAANTYTGTTVINGGTLLINGSLATTATTTVAAAGTLGGSGTLAGAVSNSGTIAPGNNAVGNLAIGGTLTMAAGSKMVWEINNWTGATGTGSDKVTTATLNITATSANRVTIRPVDLALANFTNANTTFTLIQSTANITGFSADKFTVDTSGLTVPQGTWAVKLSGDNKTLELAYTRSNTAPTFTSDPIVGSNGAEGAAYVGTLAGKATDVDAGETFSYTYVSGPTWLTVATNGTLGGTPVFGDIGANSFSVRVTDSMGASDTAVLNITVVDANQPPVITGGLGPVSTAAGYAFTGQLTSSDADAGDTRVVTRRSGPPWLTVGTDGTLSGTPAIGDMGTNTFVVRVTDAAGLFDEETLTIQVVSPYWTNPAGGSWPVAGNWLSGGVANGASMIADFSQVNLTADAAVTLDGARTIGGLAFGDITPSHNWTLNTGSGGPLTLDVASGSPKITVNNQTTTINTVLAGNDGLIKDGGGTLSLGAANTFTGPFAIQGGIVRQALNGSFASATALSVTNAALEIRYGVYNVNWVDMDSVTLGGGATLRAAPQNQGDNGDIGFKDNITVIGTNTVHATGGGYGKHNWLSGGMTGASTAFVNLTNGAGYGVYADRRAIILESAYGNWTGYQGTLRAVNDVTIKGSVELRNAKVIVDGTIGLYANGAIGEFGELTGAGTLEANAKTAGEWKIGNLGTSSTYAGIINGASKLTKTGAGTLTLTNASVHTGGTAVSGGTLLANNISGSATGSGAVTVSTGGALGGSGSITGTVANSGTLVPGNNSVGNLSISNTLTMSEGSKITWEINNWTGEAGTGWDKATVTALDLTATSTNKITIRPTDLSIANFTETNASFVLIQATNVITGFSADKFTVDTSGLTVPRGMWSVQLSADNKNLVLAYTATNPDINSNGILDHWEITRFGNANAGANRGGDDADKDGLTNLMEFALDTNPRGQNTGPIVDYKTDSGRDYLRITVNKNPQATNLIYTVETCGALNDWSAANTVIETSPSNQLIVRDIFDKTTASRRFIRLKIQTAP